MPSIKDNVVKNQRGVIAMLKIIESKGQSQNSDTAVLNRRLFKLESTVQK